MTAPGATRLGGVTRDAGAACAVVAGRWDAFACAVGGGM